jgi:hypothetical protein
MDFPSISEGDMKKIMEQLTSFMDNASHYNPMSIININLSCTPQEAQSLMELLAEMRGEVKK